MSKSALEQLLAVSKEEWKAELADQSEFFARFGDRIPRELIQQHEAVQKRFGL